MNLLVFFSVALLPLFLGFLWYHPKTFANAWMKSSGLNEEELKKGNMLLIFGLTYIFGLMLTLIMQTLVIHQTHLASLFFLQPIHDPSTESGALYKSVMDKFGDSYRTFKHGAFHGSIAALFIALPVIAINALFERRGFKYIAIHGGYWLLTFALMGACVCAFL